MKAGFIGLGTMGMGMARNLTRSGADCLICNGSDSKLDWFRERGIPTTKAAEDLSGCGCVFLCLPDGKAVREVVDRLLPGMAPGSTIVDCSTIGYLEAKALGEELAAAGIAFVDAPVSGHKAKADEGTLTIMCGGREEDFLRVKPMLDCMGTTVLLMGPWGSGQLTKMINNCALNICTASFCELMPVGVKMGLDPDQLGRVLTTASGASSASKNLIPEILKGNFDYGFSLERAYKDMAGMADLCTRFQIPLPTLNGTMQTYQLALLRGEGDRYKGAMIRFYEDLLGVECRSKPDTGDNNEGGNEHG